MGPRDPLVRRAGGAAICALLSWTLALPMALYSSPEDVQAQASLDLAPEASRLSCMRSTSLELVAAPGALEGVEALIVDFDERVLEIDLGAEGPEPDADGLRWRVSPLSAPGRLRLEPSASGFASDAQGVVARLRLRALVAGSSSIRLWRDAGAAGRLGREAARVQVTCAGMTPVPSRALDGAPDGAVADAGEDAAGEPAKSGPPPASEVEGGPSTEALSTAGSRPDPTPDASERSGSRDQLRALKPPPAALPVAGHAEAVAPPHRFASESRCFVTLPRGASVVDLALRRGLSALEIARLNRLSSLRAARAGTRLRMPGCAGR